MSSEDIRICERDFSKVTALPRNNTDEAKAWAYLFICRTLIILTARYRENYEFEEALNHAILRCKVPLDLKHHFKSVVGKYFSLRAAGARKRNRRKTKSVAKEHA